RESMPPTPRAGLRGRPIIETHKTDRPTMISQPLPPKRMASGGQLLPLVAAGLLMLAPLGTPLPPAPGQFSEPAPPPLAGGVAATRKHAFHSSPPPTSLHTRAGSSQPPLHPILALAYAPDGRTLAVAAEDKTVQLWDTSTARVRLTLRGHEEVVT